MSSNHTLERIKGDLNIKLIAMSLLAVIVAFVLFFSPFEFGRCIGCLDYLWHIFCHLFNRHFKRFKGVKAL